MAQEPRSAEVDGEFSGDYRRAIQGIRAALTEALSAAGANPGDPADLARRLKIHKLLAWRLSKIASTTDAATPVRQMPGAGGLKILDKAFAEAGVPEDRAGAFRDSIANYREMVERHAGDAATLEVMLANFDDPAFAQETLGMREQAFRGAAAVWGMQARTQLTIFAVSPTHGHDEMLDIGNVGGIIDFRRLRESIFYPAHSGSIVDDDGAVMKVGEGARPRSSLVRQFCSSPTPEFEEVDRGDHTVFTIKPGAIGGTGMLTWMLDRIMPAVASRYGRDNDELGQHSQLVRLPVELLHIDLLIHGDLPFGPPTAMLCGDLSAANARLAAFPEERIKLPMAEQVMSLGGPPPILTTPHVPRVTEMAKYLCGQLGRGLDEFRGYRFTMRYPPIPTVLYLQHPLLTR